MAYSLSQTSPKRTALTLLALNQKDGIDCPGCAWPETAGKRHRNEYCENGAKHVNDEATTKRVTRAFFAEHSVAELRESSDRWLNQQGRLTEPMVLRPGGTHYEPIAWDDAFTLIADELTDLDSPDEAAFYTSGRLNNEAAFLLQTFVRMYGTNNLPDCSNMCHESSGAALTQTLGVGKGSVQLDDIHTSDLVFVVGQNPGTNHPRMLSALEETKRNGGRVIAVNTLPEAGLIRFKNPQNARGWWVAAPRSPTGSCRSAPVGTWRFSSCSTSGSSRTTPSTTRSSPRTRRASTSSSPRRTTSPWPRPSSHRPDRGRDRGRARRRPRQQERHRVLGDGPDPAQARRPHHPGDRELPAAARQPRQARRRGLSGAWPLQRPGDRTMGIVEQAPDWFLDALGTEFGFEPPRAHGFDSVDTVRAMRDGDVKVFLGMGGNFVRAMSDSTITEEALRRCRLTVQVSTKLNHSHTVTGDTA